MVRTEGEWIKMFEAWRLAVVDLLSHRSLELERYRAMVIELFHMAPSEPQIAIQFDMDAREFYSQSPYHMDDHSHLNIPLLSQMFHIS